MAAQPAERAPDSKIKNVALMSIGEREIFTVGRHPVEQQLGPFSEKSTVIYKSYDFLKKMWVPFRAFVQGGCALKFEIKSNN